MAFNISSQFCFQCAQKHYIRICRCLYIFIAYLFVCTINDVAGDKEHEMNNTTFFLINLKKKLQMKYHWCMYTIYYSPFSRFHHIYIYSTLTNWSHRYRTGNQICIVLCLQSFVVPISLNWRVEKWYCCHDERISWYKCYWMRLNAFFDFIKNQTFYVHRNENHFTTRIR